MHHSNIILFFDSVPSAMLRRITTKTVQQALAGPCNFDHNAIPFPLSETTRLHMAPSLLNATCLSDQATAMP
jgi:hypothetical protein